MHRPELYARANKLQHRDVEEFSEEYVEEIGKMTGRCIDIGSGTGDVLVNVILPKLDPSSTIVCSDISEEMISYAKKRYGDNKRLSFVNLDIQTPDLPIELVGGFDHATSFFCLNWCQNLKQVFENINKLLRPGGTAFMSFLASYPSLEAFKVLKAMPEYKDYMVGVQVIPYFQNEKHPRQDLKDLLEVAGFEVRHCSRRERIHIFDTPNDMREFMLAVNPYGKDMPADLRVKYERDLIREIEKRKIVFNKTNNNNGQYSILALYYNFVVYIRKPSAKQ